MVPGPYVIPGPLAVPGAPKVPMPIVFWGPLVVPVPLVMGTLLWDPDIVVIPRPLMGSQSGLGTIMRPGTTTGA